MGIIMKDGHQYGIGGIERAEDVSYDNTESGMTATDVQGALDELSAGLMHRIFGSWSITTINAYQTLERTITFDSAMPDANYSVILVVSVGGAGWASIAYRIADKNTSGFKITVFNNSNSTVSNFTIEYAVLY